MAPTGAARDAWWFWFSSKPGVAFCFWDDSNFERLGAQPFHASAVKHVPLAETQLRGLLHQWKLAYRTILVNHNVVMLTYVDHYWILLAILTNRLSNLVATSQAVLSHPMEPGSGNEIPARLKGHGRILAAGRAPGIHQLFASLRESVSPSSGDSWGHKLY